MELTIKDMDLLTKDGLETLLAEHEAPCVSLFMPTERKGNETQQNGVRLKNLLRDAEEKALRAGIRSPDIRQLLDPARARIIDSLFWQHQGDGLAVFLSPESTFFYRLPFPFDPLVVIGKRFHLKPLLPILSDDGHFYIVALSQKNVRLLEGTHYTVNEVPLEGIPTSLTEILQRYDFEVSLQMEQTTGPGMTRGRPAVEFHGHGANVDEAKMKKRILEFLHELDRGLYDLLGDTRAPVVVAGVEYIRALYRQVSSFKHLMEEGIDSNPDGLPAKELHQRGWAIVNPLFHREREEAVHRYLQLLGSKDPRGLKNLEPCLQAAYSARIETLFVPQDQAYWGTFDSRTLRVSVRNEPRPGDEDLLNVAIVYTLENKGKVHVFAKRDMPDEQFVAAIARYAANENRI